MSGPPVETFCSDLGFPAGSRCLDGHFPGRPIVPGAVILAFLAARLAETGRAVARIDRLKFRRTLLPGMPFEVRLTPAGPRSRAEWLDEHGVFATALVVLRPVDG